MAKKPARLFKNTGIVPLLVLVAVFAVSAGLLYAHYSYTKEQINSEFTQEKLLSASFTAEQVHLFLEHEQVALTTMAGLLAATSDLGKGKYALQLYSKSRGRQPKNFSLFVLDNKGRFLYSVPDSLLDRYMQDLSGEGYFREVVKKGRFYQSGAQVDKEGGWEIALSAPVYTNAASGEGRLLGVLVEKINLRALDQLFIRKAEAGPEGYAFLLDESGRLIAHQKSGMLYQVESSSQTLKRMMRGEEGFEVAASPETGEPQLTVFSPVKFGGATWSVGIVSPSLDMYGPAKENLERMLLIISLMALAFSWSLVAVTRSGRYKASILERTRVSEHLLIRNRELTALNDLSRALSGVEDLDGLLLNAIDIIRLDIGAKGAAVKLASPPGGELVLKAQTGMPDDFAFRTSCADVQQCYCGKVMAGGKLVYMDLEEIARQESMQCCGLWPEGVALVPLAGKSRALGMLYLWGLADEEVSEERGKFLTALGNQLAAGIENVLQMEDTKRHAARASALFHTAQALTRSLDLDALLRIIMKEAASLLKVKRSLIMLYNEENNRVDCRVALGFDNSPAGELFFSPSGVFWESMGDGGVRVVDLTEKSQELPREFRERIGLERFVLVPLLSKGKVLGFIVLEIPGNSRAMLEDLRLIVGFANQASVAIETSSFYIRKVEKYNEDLQQLSNRIIEAQEEERKRISRDLHDELGQALTAIKINLDMAKGTIPPGLEKLRTMIGDTIGLTVSTLDSVRRLSFELRPSMLDDLGLSTVLGKLVSDFSSRAGLAVQFTEEGPSERLSPEMEVVLYRVVQEALTNIAKHSKATRVSVNLNKDTQKGMVGLYIEDDGVGFAVQQDGSAGYSKGFGLMGIRERVSLLGGNFRILTAEGRGTKLLIDIPWVKGE